MTTGQNIDKLIKLGAKVLPSVPEHDAQGLPMEIVY